MLLPLATIISATIWFGATSSFALLVPRHEPVSSACVNNSYPPQPNTNTTALPWFIINLDLPPDQRWQEVGRLYAPRIKALVEFYRTSMPNKWLRFLMTNGFNTVAPRLLARSIPSEYYHEMRGLANVANVPFGQVLLLNLFYELESLACTSIVAHTPDGQSVTHARNLDFGNYGHKTDNNTHEFIMTELMRPMAISVEFRRQNRSVMKSTQFAGYVGVLTGVKPHAFSLSVNSRHDNRSREDLLWWILRGGARKPDVGHWVAFATRLVFEQVDNFDAARAILGSYKLITPVYLTLAGTRANEGCVISRGVKNAVDERCLSGGGRNATLNPWYVLETNFDWWNVPNDGRRARAVQCMEEKNSGGAVAPAALFDVLSSKLVFNKMTLYTSLMSANEARLESYSRDCSDPDCYEW